jgi:AbrB family looped-hinge helix DNA binding protein
MATTITTKGQVTIPKALRDYLGLKPGSRVAFEIDEAGRVVVRAETKRPKSRFAKLRGSLKSGLTTDQIMALSRGEATG